MKLQTKILSGYAASLSLVVLVGLWGVFNLRQLGRASEEILQDNYLSIRAADGMIDALERQDSATLIFLLDDAKSGKELYREYEMLFLQRLGRAKDNVTIEDEPETLATLESAYRNYLQSVDQLTAASRDRTSSPDNDFLLYEKQVRPAFQTVRDAATQLRDINQEAMSSASQKADLTSRTAILSVAIAGFTAALIGLIISWILSRNLVRPVQAMYGATQQIADGNYDIQLDVKTQDELGQLAEEINVMSRRLQAFKALNLDKVVAEKQRSEAIIHSLSDGIVVVDDQLHIVAINPAAADIFETKADFALGRHCLEVIDNRTLYDQLQAALESAAPANSVEAQSELTVERSTTEHYQYLTTPVTTEDHRRLGVVLLLQNVTNLKQLDQLKSEFVMTASHELRTPLTGMAMSIDLLQETAHAKLSETEQELLQTAQEDVQRLRDLVNDLLDLSKIESGKIDIDQSEIAPDQLIDKAIALLKIQSDEKGIEVTSQVAANISKVNADANKVTWVLTNLIANALRYAKHKIEVSARPHGTWISIAVIDDGPGIDPAYQSKIFDKFVQVKTEKDVGGTGLGLAICKEMIKAHGGTIWVESKPGHGCKFAFTLPVVSAARSAGSAIPDPTPSDLILPNSIPEETAHA